MAKQTFTTGQVLTAAQMTNLQQTAMGGGSPVTKTTSYVLVAADAGTVIQMNSASSTTITVNTALFAAGDSVFIQNIGAGVCTVTAGTATVTTAGSLALTQWEGGQLYFTSTSASVFFDYIQAGTTLPLTTKGDVFGYSTTNARIPVGADATVLTADSTQALGVKWAAPSGAASSFSLINTGGTSLSGATTKTVSGISGMNTIMILIENASTNTATPNNIRLQFNSDATANYTQFGASINYAGTYNAGGATSLSYAGVSACYLGTTSSNATSSVSGGITMYGCNSSGIKVLQTVGMGDAFSTYGQENYITQGFYKGTSTISSVTIIADYTFDAGKIYIYGSAV